MLFFSFPESAAACMKIGPTGFCISHGAVESPSAK